MLNTVGGARVKTIFDLCEPRKDVVRGEIAGSDFAADLAQVIKGTAPDEYREPEIFFAKTYPTRGLKSLSASYPIRISSLQQVTYQDRKSKKQMQNGVRAGTGSH